MHERVGIGGFSTVYRGTHERLQRDAAIKVLDEKYAIDDRVRGLFLAEGRRAASIESPHVVLVFDTDETDGVAWIAMEFMPGGTLADALAADRRFAAAEVCGFGADLAAALTTAHAQRILHQRGLLDLGAITTPLDQVVPPTAAWGCKTDPTRVSMAIVHHDLASGRPGDAVLPVGHEYPIREPVALSRGSGTAQVILLLGSPRPPRCSRRR